MRNDFPISIWITEDKPIMIHCVICGYSLGIQVQGYPNSMLIGIDGANTTQQENSPLKFPFRVNCKTNSQKYGHCRGRYIIQGFIYPHKDEDEL